jgi:hypothetical protein
MKNERERGIERVLSSEEITKDIALKEIKNSKLSKDEIDEYLDIINAINKGQFVYNVSTEEGDYLIYIEKEKKGEDEDETH